MVQTIITHQCQQAAIQVSCQLNPDVGSSDDQSDLAMVHGLAVAQNIIQEYNRNKNQPVRGATIIFFRRDILGAIHKGRPHPRGEGGLVKSGHMRTQGGGGVSGKMRTSAKFKFLPKNSKFILCTVC